MRALCFGEWPVALAADGEQQRVNAGRIDRMHGMNAGQDGGDDGASEFVDDLAEDRVFLRRAADDGERPDGTVAVIDALDAEDGEVVLQAVVAEVVAEGAFGQELVGDDGAADAEVGIGVDG